MKMITKTKPTTTTTWQPKNQNKNLRFEGFWNFFRLICFASIMSYFLLEIESALSQKLEARIIHEEYVRT